MRLFRGAGFLLPMKKKLKSLLMELLRLFTENRIPIAAAGLSYYLMMTFFPIVICIYTLLGNNYDQAAKVLDYVSTLLPDQTISYLSRFLSYVAENYSVVMMLMAFSVIILTASASFRSLVNTIGALQGGRRYDGYAFFIFSIVLSLLFIAALYIGIVVMFLGEELINAIRNWISIPFIHLENSWFYLRFVFVFAIFLLILILAYEACKRKDDHYPTYPGALIATLTFVLVTVLFSRFINASIKYPLVYSSLSAIILTMFWLYCGCLVIYLGALVNVALRNIKNLKE